MSSVVIHNIRKTYGKKQELLALDDVSFEVKPGELFGIIGPDGAGKTSLFRILTTLLLPDAGTASVAGFDVQKDFKQIRRIVGYMPGKFSLYPDLTVEENLAFFATIFHSSTRENYSLIKDIYGQIEPFKHRRAGKLSGGMKQKLALSCVLIHKPRVLFLDEPTTGVDAVSRKEFWEMLRSLKEQGITILVSTPYMDEADLCDRVALVQKGKLLSVNTPKQIVGNFASPMLAIKSNNMLQLLNELQQAAYVKDIYPFGEYHHALLHNASAKEKLAAFAASHPQQQIIVKDARPGIEDCFIALMKDHDK